MNETLTELIESNETLKWLVESIGATFGDFRSALAAGREAPYGWHEDPRKVAYFFQTQRDHLVIRPMDKTGHILRDYVSLTETVECAVYYYVKTRPEAPTRDKLVFGRIFPLDGNALVAAMREAGALQGGQFYVERAPYAPNSAALQPFARDLLLAGLA